MFPRFTPTSKVGVHYWVCFSARAKGPLFIWNRETLGNYTAVAYQEHLLLFSRSLFINKRRYIALIQSFRTTLHLTEHGRCEDDAEAHQGSD